MKIGEVAATADIIQGNIRGENRSFLYMLHEKAHFDQKALLALCKHIGAIKQAAPEELRELYRIQNQILRQLVYHFDAADQSRIDDLPENYWDYIELLDEAISKLEYRSNHSGA